MSDCCTDKPILPTVKASADVQYGYLYGIVNLTCEAEAEPPANFTWYHKDNELSPKKYIIHSEGHESILQVWLNRLFLRLILYPCKTISNIIHRYSSTMRAFLVTTNAKRIISSAHSNGLLRWLKDRSQRNLPTLRYVVSTLIHSMLTLVLCERQQNESQWT